MSQQKQSSERSRIRARCVEVLPDSQPELTSTSTVNAVNADERVPFFPQWRAHVYDTRRSGGHHGLPLGRSGPLRQDLARADHDPRPGPSRTVRLLVPNYQRNFQFNLSSRYLAAGSNDATVTLWETTEWTCVRSLGYHEYLCLPLFPAATHKC